MVLSLAGWSLLTTRQLTAENRTIIERALPAVRLEVGLLEGVAALRRLEARHAVLRDAAYVRLFTERARAIESDLSTLGGLVSTPEERQTLAGAAEQLRSYRGLAERPPAEKAGIEQAAMQLETLVQRLYGQSSAELRRRGAQAGRLEEQSRLVALLAVVSQPGGVPRDRPLRERADRPPPAGASRRGRGTSSGGSSPSPSPSAGVTRSPS